MRIGVLIIHFHLEGCSSLKEKRSLIKPVEERLHRQFNVSIAEVDKQDYHTEAVLAVSLVNNNGAFIQRYMNGVLEWLDKYYPDLFVQEHHLEII